MTQRRTRDDRGLSSSLQWAVLTPVFLLCLLAAVQYGVHGHGRAVVGQAAATGAEVLAVTGDREAASRSAAAVAADLEGVQVSLTGDATVVTVQVSARVPLLVDLGLDRVQAEARAPREPIR